MARKYTVETQEILREFLAVLECLTVPARRRTEQRGYVDGHDRVLAHCNCRSDRGASS